MYFGIWGGDCDPADVWLVDMRMHLILLWVFWGAEGLGDLRLQYQGGLGMDVGTDELAGSEAQRTEGGRP